LPRATHMMQDVRWVTGLFNPFPIFVRYTYAIGFWNSSCVGSNTGASTGGWNTYSLVTAGSNALEKYGRLEKAILILKPINMGIIIKDKGSHYNRTLVHLPISIVVHLLFFQNKQDLLSFNLLQTIVTNITAYVLKNVVYISLLLVYDCPFQAKTGELILHIVTEMHETRSPQSRITHEHKQNKMEAIFFFSLVVLPFFKKKYCYWQFICCFEL